MSDSRTQPASVERLLVEHRSMLLGLARRVAKSDADADDLVQETMRRALDRQASLASAASARSWLVSILLNGFRDQCRRERGRKTTPIEDLPLAAGEPEPAPIWSRVSPEDLRAAVAELDEASRTVFRMFELEQRSYIEIAEVLGIAKNTVGTRLLRTRQRLKAILLSRMGERGEVEP